MLAAIAEGHADLADVLFLIAFIIFAIEAALAIIKSPVAATLFMPIGLALVALAWFVL